MSEIIAAATMLLGLLAILVGGYRTFRRHWLWALFLLLLLPGIWFLWAVIELFIDQPGDFSYNEKKDEKVDERNMGDQ